MACYLITVMTGSFVNSLFFVFRNDVIDNKITEIQFRLLIKSCWFHDKILFNALILKGNLFQNWNFEWSNGMCSLKNIHKQISIIYCQMYHQEIVIILDLIGIDTSRQITRLCNLESKEMKCSSYGCAKNSTMEFRSIQIFTKCIQVLRGCHGDSIFFCNKIRI